MKQFFMTLWISFWIALLLFAVMLIPVGYSTVSDIKTSTDKIQNLTESQLRNTAVAFINGIIYHNPDRKMIAPASSFRDIVENSKTNGSDLQYQEIYYTDLNGKILAHNDVTKMASSSPPISSVLLEKALQQTQRSPIYVESLASAKNDFSGADKIVYQKLLAFVPKLDHKVYHVASAVFPVDGVAPQGTLHLSAKTASLDALFISVLAKTKSALKLLFFIALVFAFFISMILVHYKYKKQKSSVAEERTQTFSDENSQSSSSYIPSYTSPRIDDIADEIRSDVEPIVNRVDCVSLVDHGNGVTAITGKGEIDYAASSLFESKNDDPLPLSEQPLNDSVKVKENPKTEVKRNEKISVTSPSLQMDEEVSLHDDEDEEIIFDEERMEESTESLPSPAATGGHEYRKVPPILDAIPLNDLWGRYRG